MGEREAGIDTLSLLLVRFERAPRIFLISWRNAVLFWKDLVPWVVIVIVKDEAPYSASWIPVCTRVTLPIEDFSKN